MVAELTSPFDSYDWEEYSVYGTVKLSCLDCQFEVLVSAADDIVGVRGLMDSHCRRNRHGIVKNGAISVSKYIQEQAQEPPKGVIITLGYLCWNTAVVSSEGVVGLLREAERIRQLGCSAHIVIVDNGSTDDTYDLIRKELDTDDTGVEVIRNMRNFGISAARNQLIDAAQDRRSDYLLSMDGDIEVVPLSTYVMLRYLECHRGLGCIGAYSANCTPDRARSSKALYEIPESRVKNDIPCAWTQYGLFRCSMFKNSLIRFDEGGPFGEPGWGFEDNDVCWQMESLGYGNKYFAGMTYLHRNIRSSFPNLKAAGVDIAKEFGRRKDYLLNKWRRKGTSPDRLQFIQAQGLPQD
jgi:hypothetical protein